MSQEFSLVHKCVSITAFGGAFVDRELGCRSARMRLRQRADFPRASGPFAWQAKHYVRKPAGDCAYEMHKALLEGLR